MKLTFLGTRGYIDETSDRHRMHSSLLLTHRGASVMIDCGEDWLGRLDDLRVDAVVVTHAHPDHAWGLKDGAPAPVYATEDAWESMRGFDISDRQVIQPRKVRRIAGITFEAFGLEHSIRCPAVGYRIVAAGARLFYAPDVAYIPDRSAAMAKASLYVGDGATIERSMIRRRGDAIFGHAPIRTQLTWCQKEHVPSAVFTHCGTEIVAMDHDAAQAKVQALAGQRHVEALIACDGLEINL